jgi:DNA-binding CsgD family transcriptional regulator
MRAAVAGTKLNQAMDGVGCLLLSIYRTAREVPHAQFHDAVLELVKRAIPFDFAKWGTSQVTESGVVFHVAHLHHESPEAMDAYALVRHEDRAAFFIARHLGMTGNFHNPTYFSGRQHAAIRDYLQRYRHHNSLITGLRDARTGLMNSISLYRADVDTQYCERERRLCQCLVPHLMEALSINQLLEIEQLRLPHSRSVASMAIADPFGVVYFAEPSFNALVHAEWPNCPVTLIPTPLQRALLETRDERFLGRSVVVTWVLNGSLFFLRARHRLPVDALTPRELMVARDVSSGMTHKEIARHLHIAPATVRNHLSTIHERAQARNNAELVAQLRVAGY